MLRGAHRVDVNSLHPHEGVTALHLATRGQHPEAVQTLLDHGADMHLQTKCGDSALHVAVCHNAHGCLRKLLAHLSSTSRAGDKEERRFTNPQEQTILHHAARVGDLETLKVLAEVGINTLRNTGILGDADITSKNVEGHTPEEVFSQRQSGNPDIQTASVFASLMEALKKGSQIAADAEDEEDEFHDALMDLED